MKTKIASRLFFIATCLVIVSPASAYQHWPQIRDTRKAVFIRDANSRDARLDLAIRGKDGNPLYEIRCHSGNSEDAAYSGLMQCYLLSLYSKERVENLFNETLKPISDWTNRGRFLSQHLRPGCAQYSEWGAVRHFRLRNMEITLEISNVTFIPEPVTPASIVNSYRLVVSARNAANAETSLTEPVKISEPRWFYNDAKCKSGRAR